ncbi:MAG: HAD family hydrolase [Planctomycetota bacterium]|jgi:hypothetical protein
MKTICFDFDGVLDQYDGWKGHRCLGKPVEGMSKLLQQLQDDGWQVIIFTTRGNVEVAEWCSVYDIVYDSINMNPAIQGQNPGKPIADIYVDDRAICFTGDVDKLQDDILTFKPWSSSE